MSRIQTRARWHRSWPLLALALSAIASPALAQSAPSPAAAAAEEEEEAEEQDGAPAPAGQSASDGATSPTATSKPSATTSPATPVEATPEPAAEQPPKSRWEMGFKGYFRAPIALAMSNRPNPDRLTEKPQLQISYGPNRTVDANYYSFGYTRLQEQDWVELFVTAKAKHVEATVGWMGYWFASSGFRNPDAAWLPGIAYLTIDTDLDLGGIKPNIALSGGSWWPNFGRHEKYDTFTLGQFRQMGEQLKLTVPLSDRLTVTAVQGFGTGRDGSFNILAPPPYQAKVGLNLIHYAHLQLSYGKVFDIGLHQNLQWTRDPNLLLQTSAGKSYTNAHEAKLMTVGAEAKVSVPHAGSLWVSPSVVLVKNGWALGEAGVEVVHSLSPEGVAGNYFGWSGSPANSTGTGKLVNVGFIYENTLANVLGAPAASVPRVTGSAFGLLVDSHLGLPAGSAIGQKRITHFKWGADVEYNPWNWLGVMARWDTVNYDMDHGGYIFSAITARLSLYSHYASGERVYLQYSRYRYGDKMVLAGRWPWGNPLVAGSDIIQGGPYAGSKPDMDVVKIQADIHF
jgi:hypothetical protein